MQKKAFCSECGKDTDYKIQKIFTKQKVRDKEYKVETTIGVCQECGEEMNIPGLMDLNLKKEDEEIRKVRNLVTIEEIQDLMELYHIGKAPLSLALGFGEVTLTRYLEGQLPSKTYSEIMGRALRSYTFMESLLCNNQDKLAKTAFKKSMEVIDGYHKLDSISEEMLQTVSYLFTKLEDVSIYTLHKLLYFVEGFYEAVYLKPFFKEECVAFSQGPVFTALFDFMKDFTFDPTEDVRFYFLKDRYLQLSEEAKVIIDLVLNTFGMYSGKSLQTIIQKETPWIHATQQNLDTGAANIISKEDMKRYFLWVLKKFGVSSDENVNRYICYKLSSGDGMPFVQTP